MSYIRISVNGYGFSVYGIAFIDGDTVTPLPCAYTVRDECDSEVERLEAKLNEPVVTIIEDGDTIEA